MRKQHLRTILIVLFAGIFVILAGPPVVYSQFLPCNVVNLAPTGPPTVGAGQTLQVTTTVTGSCDQSMFYAVRVDLVDGRSSQVLSSVVFPYAPVTPVFTVSITNKATAPTTLGSWVLQVNAYLIAAMNGAVVASAHELFSVMVVPYTTTTTTEQLITNSTTTLSQNSTNSTSQATSTSETLIATSTSSAAAPETNSQNSTYVTIAAVVVILAAIIIVLLSKRKHATTQKPQPQLRANVKYCEHCGTKLNATDEFCGHCGTKQA